MKKLLSNKWYVTVFVAPGLILFLVMAVIPLFTTGYYGLFNYDGIGQKVFIGFKELQRTVYNGPIFQASRFELLYSGSRLFVYSDSDCIISGYCSGK